MKHWIVEDVVDGSTVQVDLNEGAATRESPDPGAVQASAPKRLLCGGLTDLQVNGYREIDFSEPELSIDQAESICRELASLGVTHFLATLTTQSSDRLHQALANLDRLADESHLLGRMMIGIHLEGPYISPVDGPRGAHPLQFCREPSVVEFEAFQKSSGNRIMVVTMSPEYEKSSEFIDLVSDNVIVSIGHTNASPEQIRDAVNQGATMSTHLGNGMHKELIRHPNYLWEQLAEDRLAAGFIADGVHLDAAALKSMVRAKGIDRCFLVSDSTLLSGMPPGLYPNSALGDVEVTEDRRLVIAGQRTFNAGAYRPLKDAVPFLLGNEIVDLKGAIQMMVQNPKQILLQKYPNRDLDSGFKESFVVFEINDLHQMHVLCTVVNGQTVFLA